MGEPRLTMDERAALAAAPRKPDYLTPEQRRFDDERRRAARENAWMAVPALAPAAAVAAAEGVPLAAAAAVNAARFIARGGEWDFGPNFRIAPFGNRTGHPIGRYPHYHRRDPTVNGVGKAGQGISRHRPWEQKSNDKSIWDRF
jgi:hypothetical protein